MKKLLTVIFLVFGSFTLVSADIGVNIGGSVAIGEYSAIGSENENTEVSAKRTEKAYGGMGSLFIEKELGFLPGPLKRLTLGYDSVLHDVSTGTRDTNRNNREGSSNTTVAVQQKVSADLTNIASVYATLRITDWLYVKGGEISLDVKTTESLTTGSQYGDASLTGTILGFGLAHKADNGLFFRAEYLDTEIDGITLTSTTNADNSVTLDGIDGESVAISIGKTF